MRRRDIIVGGGCVAFAALTVPRLSSSQDTSTEVEVVEPDFSEAPPAIFPEGVRVPTLEEYRQSMLDALTGAKDPYGPEIDLGNELLKDIPTGKTPYEIAHRFYEWRKGLVGEGQRKKQYSYYAREWPIRGNPVIMGFFDATGYRTPAGDTTWWCSAFVSWCIERSRVGKKDAEKVWPYARGAASAAYRDWGKNVLTELQSQPRRGDLVVFQNTSVSYQGHVGFVHSVEGDDIMVLGGNQGAQNEYNGGEVNIASFSMKGGGRLRFHSFRRHEVLS